MEAVAGDDAGKQRGVELDGDAALGDGSGALSTGTPVAVRVFDADAAALIEPEQITKLANLPSREQLLAELARANSAKYPPAPGSDAGSWYFRLDHRGG